MPSLVSNCSSGSLYDYTVKKERQANDLFNNDLVIDLIRTNRVFKSVIVLAEGWPSWVYAISGLFADAKIHAASHSSLLMEYHHHWFGRDVHW